MVDWNEIGFAVLRTGKMDTAAVATYPTLLRRLKLCMGEERGGSHWCGVFSWCQCLLIVSLTSWGVYSLVGKAASGCRGTGKLDGPPLLR